MLRKKGEEEGGSVTVVIALIIMLVVLVAIVFLIFRVDIIQMIKDLPGYHYNATDTVIDWNKIPDAGKFDICPTGKIVAEIKGNYLYFDSNGRWVASRLYWEGDEVTGKIIFYRGFWTGTLLSRNDEVATVEKRVITLTPEFKDSLSSVFSDIKPVTFKDISSLEGAHMASSNYLCEGTGAAVTTPIIPTAAGRVSIVYDASDSNLYHINLDSVDSKFTLVRRESSSDPLVVWDLNNPAGEEVATYNEISTTGNLDFSWGNVPDFLKGVGFHYNFETKELSTYNPSQ